jgi:hypothetical protein
MCRRERQKTKNKKRKAWFSIHLFAFGGKSMASMSKKIERKLRV